jgi:6-phosphogluconate dehydrogenase
MDVKEIGDVFENWNKGELNSFLIEITYKIMRKIDEETGKPLVNLILDKAEQKGTGKWTAQAALDLGIPTPSLNFALITRVISHFKEDRVNLSKMFEKRISSVSIDKVRLLEDLEKALLFSIFISFSQGLWLISQASDTYDYGINLSEVTRIWKNGCIIRAKMLDFLKNILEEDKSNVYLLKSEKALSFLKNKVDSVINVTEVARKFWVPTPVLNSSLDFLFSMVERNLPANLIQAQRDFFGAHTFERIDKEGIFHVEWIELD